ncbi:MAG: hypothetical protein HY982_00575 [Candidatus Magasanikbacteria bacterium]|nr:hypothetical protein [Candidatus Magasanikbacteria bacterium]
MEQSRNNLVRLSEIMRTTFGEDIMAKTIVRDVKKDAHSLIVVDGIRRPADIVYLEKLPNFVLVEIFAAPQTRYRRLVQRGENADDKNKTYKQFLADNRRSTEISILQVIKKAKEKIDNNGDEKKLQKQLNALVAKYSPS